MAQSTSPADKTKSQKTDKNLAPPDEAFWQRYSPHAEFPLSGAGSFAVHVLAFGMLGLMAWLGAVLFNHSNRSLPVEAVRLAGGGGNPHGGPADGSNRGTDPVEVGNATPERAEENRPPDDSSQPNLEVKPAEVKNIPFDRAGTRFLNKPSTDSAAAFARLNEMASKIRLTDRAPAGSQGQGGTGSGGGSGDRQGTGVGPGTEPGHGNLTKREKRNIRWTLGFNSQNTADYLAQLQGLGAILAIPVHEKGKFCEYRLIRNLSGRPPRMLKEDISKLNRINWYDSNPNSVAGVMSYLHLHLRPSHFIAFMPEELEQKLYSLEKNYLDKHYPGRTEDDIESTKFQVRRSGGKYEPVMEELKVKE